MDLSEIGRQFGLNEAQTGAAVEALTPVVAAGMRRNGGAGRRAERHHQVDHAGRGSGRNGRCDQSGQ